MERREYHCNSRLDEAHRDSGFQFMPSLTKTSCTVEEPGKGREQENFLEQLKKMIIITELL